MSLRLNAWQEVCAQSAVTSLSALPVLLLSSMLWWWSWDHAGAPAAAELASGIFLRLSMKAGAYHGLTGFGANTDLKKL